MYLFLHLTQYMYVDNYTKVQVYVHMVPKEASFVVHIHVINNINCSFSDICVAKVVHICLSVCTCNDLLEYQ